MSINLALYNCIDNPATKESIETVLDPIIESVEIAKPKITRTKRNDKDYPDNITGYHQQYSGHLLRRKMIDRDKKSNSSLKVQVETKYKMNCSMDIVQNLLTKVGNLANRNASS